VYCADTIAPAVSLSQYSEGGGPAPCTNIADQETTFEAFANEVNVDLHCRLSRWSPAIGDFDGAIERWSSASVQAWLRLPAHLADADVATNLSILADNLATATGSVLTTLDDVALRQAPYSIDSASNTSSLRLALLTAISKQRGLYSVCYRGATSIVVIRVAGAELDYGLKLLEVRAVDSANNIGNPAQYIWFIGISLAFIRFLYPLSR
jgi:hypothetical protein